MTDRDDRTATGGPGVAAGAGTDGDAGTTPSPEREPLEPGTPDPEHAAFVLVGVVATLAVLYVGLVGGP
jgi:hypothetical protein